MRGLYLHSPNTSSWRGAYLSTGTTLPLRFTFYTLFIRHVSEIVMVRF